MHLERSGSIDVNTAVENLDERKLGLSIRRGFALKCPSCGKGRVLHKYLKVNDNCTVCGLDLSYARADDGPAYFTILLVSHLAGFALHIMWSAWQPSPLVMASTLSVGVLVLSLLLLPRFKGAIIGFQWAKGLHGF